MNTRLAFGTAWALTLLVIGAGLFFYASLPEIMMSHWNARGVPDGMMPKFWGVFLMPLSMALAVSILAAVPHVDPLKSNIELFRRQYNIFVVLLTAALAFIQLAVLAINLGANFNISSVILPAIGVLLFCLGSFLPQTKRNWFIGIRTPWTLSSDAAWERTHVMGGWVFRLLGVLAIVSILFPERVLPIFLAPTIVAFVGLVAYSYFVYRETSGRQLSK